MWRTGQERPVGSRKGIAEWSMTGAVVDTGRVFSTPEMTVVEEIVRLRSNGAW